MFTGMTSTTTSPTVPFQAGVYGLDSLSVNPYQSVQQSYNMGFNSTLAPSASYSGASAMQSAAPALSNSQNEYSQVRKSPTIKSEAHSPASPNLVFNESIYGEDYKTSSSGESESGINFSTDVDTLMKAIQGKASTAQQPLPQQVRHHNNARESLADAQLQASQEPTDTSRVNLKSRKRYQCAVPDCGKSFYQKTHLEIHTRAHTGHKPFVRSLFGAVSHVD